MRLDGKVALITGAGAGLGRESALLFAREGARVVVTDLNGDRVGETAALVEAQGGEALALTVDVTVEDQVRDAVAATVERFGALDVLFANAGIIVRGNGSVPFEELSAESWQQVMDVNLTGVFHSCKHAIGPMKANGGGAIVVTSSAVAFVSTRGLAAYAATKGGVNALVRGLAVEIGHHGIRINAICPLHGMSANFLMAGDADVVGGSMEEGRGAWDPSQSLMPLKLGRAPSLRDNANAALFLASDDSAYVTGVCLPTTDGGVLSGLYLQP
jgi:NAD(P)-dependent dehydrogenase (short-subunit alcohol dehydrogenase family)